MAPPNTKICHKKCDIPLLNAKGIIPTVYTIPPDKIHIKKLKFSLYILGTNNNADQPNNTYNG